MSQPLLELRDVSCSKDNSSLFTNVNLTMNEGDIVVLRGKSGSGKTTLLKCIAHLILHDGQIFYRGRTPKSLGIPLFRTRVLYVPQRPSMLPGSPKDFLTTITSLESHKVGNQYSGRKDADDSLRRATEVSKEWDIDPQLWERHWSSLSGGEAQRLALAIAVGLDTAEVILLDEPTSALDPVSSALLEKFMVTELHGPNRTLKSILWITHSEEQGSRIGTRFIQLSAGGCCEEAVPLV